jgi:hypothetical protein
MMHLAKLVVFVKLGMIATWTRRLNCSYTHTHIETSQQD